MYICTHTLYIYSYVQSCTLNTKRSHFHGLRNYVSPKNWHCISKYVAVREGMLGKKSESLFSFNKWSGGGVFFLCDAAVDAVLSFHSFPLLLLHHLFLPPFVIAFIRVISSFQCSHRMKSKMRSWENAYASGGVCVHSSTNYSTFFPFSCSFGKTQLHNY